MKYIKKQKDLPIPWYVVAATVIFIIVQENPYIYKGFGSLYMFGPALLVLFLSINYIIDFCQDHIRFVLTTAFFFSISLLYKVVNYSHATIGGDLHVILYFAIFMMMPVIMKMNRNQKKVVLSISLISMMNVLIYNTRVYNKLGTYYFEIEAQYAINNLVSTQYSTMLVLMCGMLIILTLHDKVILRKALWMALFVVCNLFNFIVMQRATSLILSFVLYILVMIAYINDRRVKSIIIIFSIIILVYCIVNVADIFESLNHRIDSIRIERRLDQIHSFLESGDIEAAGGSMMGRFELIQRSLNTWTSSVKTFFFGAGQHQYSDIIIGHHSQVADVIAEYGLIGGFMAFCSVFFTLKTWVTAEVIPVNSMCKRQMLAVCFVFVMRSIIGGAVHDAVASRMFIFFPISISLIFQTDEWQNIDNNRYHCPKLRYANSNLCKYEI